MLNFHERKTANVSERITFADRAGLCQRAVICSWSKKGGAAVSVLKEIWKEMYAHRENPPQPDSDASFLAGLLAYYEKIMEKEFS